MYSDSFYPGFNNLFILPYVKKGFFCLMFFGHFAVIFAIFLSISKDLTKTEGQSGCRPLGFFSSPLLGFVFGVIFPRGCGSYAIKKSPSIFATIPESLDVDDVDHFPFPPIRGHSKWLIAMVSCCPLSRVCSLSKWPFCGV